MTNEEFKDKARRHQVEFKAKEFGISEDRSPEIVIRRKDSGKATIAKVKSSLLNEDLRDTDGGFVIFCPEFRDEITKEVDSIHSASKGPMVSNLLRSEHIPYNVFFPMKHDLAGTTKLMNSILDAQKIQSIDDVMIEYNPGGLHDGTSFDVYMPYTTLAGGKGGIGIEVKYTEKEYLIKRGSKEWNETHNDSGIHLSDNYMKLSVKSGWFKNEYICDIPFADAQKCREHVAANRYRQIWRNHILGASMVLGLCESPDDKLDEFISLTVYPEDNGHFDNTLWEAYKGKLTTSGKETIKTITYEKLFPLMREYLSQAAIPQRNSWIDYLESRYYIK